MSLENVVRWGATAAGAIIGGAIGFAIGGPAGVYEGALTGAGLAAAVFFRPTASDDDSLSSSETYGWNNIGTVLDVLNKPIPVVYGKHKMGGRRIQAFTKLEADHDYLYLLLLLCEGEILDIQDIEINGQPVDNYQDVTTWKRYGTAGQTSIPDFQDNVLQTTQGNLRLDVNPDFAEYTSGNRVEKLRFKVICPVGLYHYVGGVYQYTNVNLRFQFKPIGEGWGGPNTVDLLRTISGNKESTLRFEWTFDTPTFDYYDVRVWRWEANREDEAIHNITNLASITEIDLENNTYPNCALLGIKIRATYQLSGSIPDVTCTVYGRKVLDNIPIAATGWTDNPAWCLYDLLTDTRYGAGAYITPDKLDLQSFQDVADLCDTVVNDGFGGTEKQHILNLVIDSRQRTLDLMNHIAATFRALIYYTDGKIVLFQDQAALPVAQLFTRGNIKQDPKIVWQYSDRNTLYNSCEVEFLDESRRYERNSIVVPLTEGLSGPDLEPKKTLSFYGCTRMSQAVRETRLALRKAHKENIVISFEAMIDAVHCRPGDVIWLGHEVPETAGDLSGRIVDYGNDYVVLDRSFNIEAGKTYDIALTLANDTVEEVRVTNTAGETSVIQLNETFAALGANPRDASPYVIGESAFTKEEYRILSIQRKNDHDVQITAVKRDSSVFDDLDDFTLDPVDEIEAFDANAAPKHVENLSLSESFVPLGGGAYRIDLNVFFSPPEGDMSWDHARVYYDSKYDPASPSWTYLGDSAGNYTIPNVPEGNTVAVKVQSVSGTGVFAPLDSSPVASRYILGQSAPPPDVVTFTATQPNGYVLLQWNFNNDPLIDHYEIRRGSTWATAQVITNNATGTQHEDHNVFNSTYEYLIKAVSPTGSYSSNAISAWVNVSGISVAGVLQNIEEEPDWDGDSFALKRVLDGSDWVLVKRSGFDEMRWKDFLYEEQTWADQYGPSDTWVVDNERILAYETQVQDAGAVKSIQVLADYGIDFTSAGAAWNDVFTATDTWADVFAPGDTWLDKIGSTPDVKLQMRFSDDNVTWSAWQDYAPGFYTFRYIKLRILVTLNNDNEDVKIRWLHWQTEVTPLNVLVNNFYIDIAGSTLTYANHLDQYGNPAVFINPPDRIGITVVGATGSVTPTYLNKTNTEVDLKAFDSSDNPIDCFADVQIVGK